MACERGAAAEMTCSAFPSLFVKKWVGLNQLRDPTARESCRLEYILNNALSRALTKKNEIFLICCTRNPQCPKFTQAKQLRLRLCFVIPALLWVSVKAFRVLNTLSSHFHVHRSNALLWSTWNSGSVRPKMGWQLNDFDLIFIFEVFQSALYLLYPYLIQAEVRSSQKRWSESCTACTSGLLKFHVWCSHPVLR